MEEFFYTILILMFFGNQRNTKTFTNQEILTEKRNIEKKERLPLDKRKKFAKILKIF